ncbi:hypothetical protein F4778DRAFT_737573, partial [Xylariomycetidae sp. FL2044]
MSSDNTTPMPPELWLMVAENLPRDKKVNHYYSSLSRTNKFMYGLITPLLYGNNYEGRPQQFDYTSQLIPFFRTVVRNARLANYVKGLRCPSVASTATGGWDVGNKEDHEDCATLAEEIAIRLGIKASAIDYKNAEETTAYIIELLLCLLPNLETLELCPNHAAHFSSYFDRWASKSHIPRLPALKHLKLCLSWCRFDGIPPSDPRIRTSLESLVNAAPNLKKLEMPTESIIATSMDLSKLKELWFVWSGLTPAQDHHKDKEQIVKVLQSCSSLELVYYRGDLLTPTSLITALKPSRDTLQYLILHSRIPPHAIHQDPLDLEDFEALHTVYLDQSAMHCFLSRPPESLLTDLLRGTRIKRLWIHHAVPAIHRPLVKLLRDIQRGLHSGLKDVQVHTDNESRLKWLQRIAFENVDEGRFLPRHVVDVLKEKFSAVGVKFSYDDVHNLWAID